MEILDSNPCSHMIVIVELDPQSILKLITDTDNSARSVVNGLNAIVSFPQGQARPFARMMFNVHFPQIFLSPV